MGSHKIIALCLAHITNDNVLKVIHIVAGIRIVLPFYGCVTFHGTATLHLFTCAPADGHVGPFQPDTAMACAAVNSRVCCGGSSTSVQHFTGLLGHETAHGAGCQMGRLPVSR